MEIIIAVAAASPCLSIAFTNSPILPILLVLPQFLPCQFLRFPQPSLGGLCSLLFFGILGIHRFHGGKVGTGLLYLFTGGLCGIGWLIAFIMTVCGSFTDKAGLSLKLQFLFEACWVKYLLFISFPCSFLLKPSKARIYTLCL